MAEKRKKFNLYEFINKGNGQGVSKEEKNHPRNLKYFFKLLKNNFTNIMYVNFYLAFGNFPILFAILAFFSIKEIPTPSTFPFAQIYGAVRQTGFDAAIAALYGAHGVRSNINIPTVTTYVLLGLSLLVIFTSGLINTGTGFLLRNIVKGEPVFMWNDFWYAIKKNWKQGLIMGVIDFVAVVLMVWNISKMYSISSSYFTGLIFYGNILLLLVYLVMRFYSYILIVTFDLSIFKIIKNAFIFSILGIKRNLLALLGIAILAAVELFFVIMFIPIAVILPFFILIGLARFMGIYAAFPKIKEIMIDPYYKEEEKEYEEPICKDNG